MGKRIKYMGIADRQLLMKGDDFGGRLGEGIPQDVEFNKKNNWIVDAEAVGLSDAAVEVLVSTPSFRDVTDMERIPLNRNQTTFMGLRDGDSVVAPVEDDEDLQYAAAENSSADEQAKRDAVEAERLRLEAEEQERIAQAEAEANKKKK